MAYVVVTVFGAEAHFDDLDGAEGYARELVAGGVAPRAVVVDHDARTIDDAIKAGPVFDTGPSATKPDPCPCGYGDACWYESDCTGAR